MCARAATPFRIASWWLQAAASETQRLKLIVPRRLAEKVETSQAPRASAVARGLTNAAAARPEVRRASVVPAALAAPNVVDTTEKPAVTALSVSVALAGPEVRAAARMLPPAEAEAVVGITAAAVAAVVVT
jgi:hypothetical protein